MTMHVYRDTSCASLSEAAFELYTRLVAHGWAAVAWSDGTTRTAGAGPASAANLSAANAWFVVQHTATGRKFSYKRDASAATSCQFQHTDASALSAGNSTTPDAHATYTKTFLGSQQWYPSTGTTTTKAHTVVDDATASFVMLLRRSPFVGGSACSYVSFDQVTPLTWAANPEPLVASARFRDGNDAPETGLFSSNTGNTGWSRRGLSGEGWSGTQWYLENPANVAGSAVVDPSGSDVEYEVRWCYVDVAFIMGRSTLYRALQPYRSPTTGLDGSGNFSRAAFGRMTVPNDGAALGS